MSDTELENQVPQVDELTLLKERATQIGLSFHPNIGVDKLRDRVNAKLNPSKSDDSAEEEPVQEQNDEQPTEEEVAAARAILARIAGDEAESIADFDKVRNAVTHIPNKKQTAAMIKSARIKRAKRLVRVVVTCMNPNKSNMKGEIFTAGNGEVGFLSKFVPFGADEGYHVPKMILNMIKARQYTTFYTTKDHRGRDIKATRLVNEFAVNVLPDLTYKELKALQQRQLMAKGGAE